LSRNADRSFKPREAYPEGALVTATTHDLPTLAGFWTGHDLTWRGRIGHLADEQAMAAARSEREIDRHALIERLIHAGCLEGDPRGDGDDEEAWMRVLEAVYGFLAGTSGALLMVALEDALCELEQPNVPGTVDLHPNWRRRLSVPLEAMLCDERLQRLVRTVARLRPAGSSQDGEDQAPEREPREPDL